MKKLPGLAASLIILSGCGPAPAVSSPEPAVVEGEALELDVPREKNARERGDPWARWDGYGTVWVTPDLITPESPSDFVELTLRGLGQWETFDRRVDAFIVNDSYIFTATFRCVSQQVDVVVNAEFSEEEAWRKAQYFSHVLGQMPVGLRGGVKELWVHAGNEAAGGGNNSILIHSGEAQMHTDFIEEIFVHESAHATLDPDWGGAVDRAMWSDAVASDGRFISGYAEEVPDGEDIAESYSAFLIWATHRDRGAFPESAPGIEALIPSRLNLFESLGPDFGPLPESCGSPTLEETRGSEAPAERGQ